MCLALGVVTRVGAVSQAAKRAPELIGEVQQTFYFIFTACLDVRRLGRFLGVARQIQGVLGISENRNTVKTHNKL